MARIRFDRATCATESLKREWLETNALGGYASSTICGANTRRYHGLLVAAIEQGRFVLLAKVEETLLIGADRFEISTNLYTGAVHPQGTQFLKEFRMDPFPVFTFEAGGVTVEKRVFLVDGENTAVVEYTILNGSNCRIEVRPLLAFRGYHELTHSNSSLNDSVTQSKEKPSIQPYAGLPRLFFAHNADTLGTVREWYFNFEYPLEQERGLDFHEDLYCPFTLGFELAPERPAVLIASTLEHESTDAPSLKAAEIARRSEFHCLLETAANQFIVRRENRPTIIAGYPWFTDWGRDTMISLPGLTLATGRHETAREILFTQAGYVDQGLLPNFFGNAQEQPAYNSADAALWLFEAVRQYVRYSGDLDFVRKDLYPVLGNIVECYSRGTRGGIHLDRDGLIIAGDENTQLTWMDARVDGRPVTPRHGKPVELQGLWYNAVRLMQTLAQEFGDPHGRVYYESLAIRAAASFGALFWYPQGGYLFDVLRPDGSGDPSLRPNQLVALSLGYCAIPPERARRILSVVEAHLLTPFGLRTLSPDDPAYCGRCEGPPSVRDAAYHQGTVWPWLLGPFIAASMRFDPARTRKRLPEILRPLSEYMETRGCGQIPEIFDGEPPHQARGAFAQAWSVAEILRSRATIRQE